MNQLKSEGCDLRDKPEFDDSSECSQNSALASQTDCDLSVKMIPVEDSFKSEEDPVNEAVDADIVHPPEYYASVVDAAQIPEIACSAGLMSANAADQILSHENKGSGNMIRPIASHDPLSNSFLEINQRSQGLEKTSDNITDRANTNCERQSKLFRDAFRVKDPCTKSSFPGSEEQNSLMSESSCFTSTIIGSGMNPDFPCGGGPFTSSSFVNLNIFQGTISCQSRIPTTGTCMNFAPVSQAFFPVIPSNVVGIPYCQGLMAAIPPSFICGSDGRLLDGSDNVSVADAAGSMQDSDDMESSHVNFAHSNSSPISAAGLDMSKLCLPADTSEQNETLKQTFMEMMGLGPTGAIENLSLSDGNGNVQTEHPDSGGLFYEPPRVPTFEVPFVSCDLISSSEQQAFSPLGIRQIMMSSTPYGLWDSPSHDDSPDAILKNAAKNFICTPSIMKKRQRELLSPLQEKRSDKKYGRDMKRGFMCTSCIYKESSCTDASIDENVSNGIPSCSAEDFLVSPSYYQKTDPGTSTEQDKNQDSSTCHEEGTISGKASDASDVQEKMEASTTGMKVLTRIMA